MVPEGIKKTAVICVLKNDKKFLLLKRLKEPNKDKYTPVGGKLDPFETPIKAAIRETYEETGIKVETMKYCGTLLETSPTSYNWTSFIYLAEIDFIDPPTCNEGTLEWIDYENLLNIPTPETDWYIYKYLLNDKLFHFNAEYDKELKMISLYDELSKKTLKNKFRL